MFFASLGLNFEPPLGLDDLNGPRTRSGGLNDLNVLNGVPVCNLELLNRTLNFEPRLALDGAPLRQNLAETDTGKKYSENESRFQRRNSHGKRRSFSRLRTDDVGQFLSCNLSHFRNVIDAVDTNFAGPQ
jgi:hypothetical protein